MRFVKRESMHGDLSVPRRTDRARRHLVKFTCLLVISGVLTSGCTHAGAESADRTTSKEPSAQEHSTAEGSGDLTVSPGTGAEAFPEQLAGKPLSDPVKKATETLRSWLPGKGQSPSECAHQVRALKVALRKVAQAHVTYYQAGYGTDQPSDPNTESFSLTLTIPPKTQAVQHFERRYQRYINCQDRHGGYNHQSKKVNDLFIRQIAWRRQVPPLGLTRVITVTLADGASLSLMCTAVTTTQCINAYQTALQKVTNGSGPEVQLMRPWCVAPKDRPSILDPQTPFESLLSLLREASADRDHQLAKDAADLLNEVKALHPTPSTSREGLGRLRFEDIDVDAQLSTLIKQMGRQCQGHRLIDRKGLTNFHTQGGPAPTSDGSVRLGDVYGRCKDGASPAGWIAPFTVVQQCKKAVYAVDLTNGAATKVSGVNRGTRIFVFGDRIAWATKTEHPATGLQRPTWSATLHLRGISGKADSDIPLVTKAKGHPPQVLIDHPDLWGGADADKLLIYAGAHGEDEVRFVNTSGEFLGFPDHAGYDARFITLHTVITSNEDTQALLLNTNTGKVIQDLGDMNSLQWNSNVCHTTAGVRVGGEKSYAIQDKDPARIDVHDLPGDEKLLDARIHATPVGIVYDTYLYGPYKLVGRSLTGEKHWSIPSRVFKSYNVVGKWVTVTNNSGNGVLVDAATGKDVTDNHRNLANRIFHIADSDGQTVLSDPSTDSIVITTSQHGRNLAYHLNYHRMCT